MKKIGRIKKGLIYALIMTMLGSSTIGMTPLKVSAATTGTVNASALNVRSGAGTGYLVVGTLTHGQTVTIVDSMEASDGHTWYKISGTTSGYVRADYISNVASDSINNTTGTIITDILNVRTGPGRNYLTKGTVSYGTNVTILSQSGEWYKVTYVMDEKTQTGYVHSDFVGLDKPSTENEETTEETVIANGVVNAGTLNLRSGAGIHYESEDIVGVNTSVEILSRSGSWYKVRCTVGDTKKDGYLHANYVTETAEVYTITKANVTGVVNADVLNVRSGASQSTSIIDKLYMNDKVVVSHQADGWTCVEYKKNGSEKEGYVASEYLTLTLELGETIVLQEPDNGSVVAPTPGGDDPVVTPTPEDSTQKGVVNGSNVNVRKEPSTTAQAYGQVNQGTEVIILAKEGDWYKVKVVVNGVTVEGYIYADYVTVQNSSSDGSSSQNPSQQSNIGILTGDGVRLRTGPGTSYSSLGQLRMGTFVTILDEVNGWYKVSCLVSGVVKEGYIYGEFVKRLNAHNEPYEGTLDSAFENQIKNFPESYKNALRRLHDAHPQWKFVAYKTGLNFNSVLEAQYDGEISMIYFSEGTTPYSWLSTKEGDYDWATDTYANRDGASWKSASKEVLAYYLDPRNFLVEGEIFMFESMEYNPSQSRAVVASILEGSYMTDGKTYTYNGKTYTYVDTFMEAGEIANVSSYILASRSRQEVGGGSGSVTGPNYYNFYNIGANASASGNAVSNGLAYAAGSGSWRRPWTNPWLAIVGGAEFLAASYIAKGQNTDYFQKFNVVTKPYHQHQYMGNIQAPAHEGSSRYSSYKEIGVLDSNFTFIIPVYENMPSTACQMPIETGNPNGYIKTLKVSGMDLNQTFKYNVTNYYGATNQSSVTISATPVSKHATVISGTGTHSLKVGENVIKVVCQAGNGDLVTYTLKITRY